MRERPILMSAPMVRALLAGTKTQTRRVCKPAANLSAVVACQDPATYREGQRPPYITPGWFGDEEGDVQFFCSYGAPGDRLWVREAWARDDEDGALFYRADVGSCNEADDWERNRLDGVARYRWRPSIHMPRAASRITLEITGVRVERLQDISRGDAMAEGCPFPNMAHGADPRAWFADLWQEINGPGSWGADPWVWVIEFQTRRGTA